MCIRDRHSTAHSYPHMSNQTPRVDPQYIAQLQSPVFRIIGKVVSQTGGQEIVITSPTTGGEMITLSNAKTAATNNFEIDNWYEFVCRSNDSGDAGFLVLDAVKCVLAPGEPLSVNGVVALQQLSSQFPELY